MHIKQAHQLSWCAWVFWYDFIWFHVSTRHGAYSMLFNLHLLFFPGFHLMPVSSSCTHTGEENHSCRRHHNNSWIYAVKYPEYTILLLPPVWSGAGERKLYRSIRSWLSWVRQTVSICKQPGRTIPAPLLSGAGHHGCKIRPDDVHWSYR